MREHGAYYVTAEHETEMYILSVKENEETRYTLGS